MRFPLILLLLSFFLLLLCSPVLYAREGKLASACLNLTGDHLIGELYIRDQLILSLHHEGVYDPEVRVQVIADKINNLYSKGFSVDKIFYKVDLEKEEKKVISATIYWGEEKFFTISNLQARLNKSTPEKLAVLWVENLKKALSLSPTLKVFPSHVLLCPGEVIDIKIMGNSIGKLTWKIASPVIDLKQTDFPDRFVLKGRSIGDTTIDFQREGIRTQINISVREEEVTITQPRDILVSGFPCQTEIIRESVIREINSSVLLKSGLRLSIDPFNINTPSLSEGKVVTLLVPFKIENQGSHSEKMLPVKVRNESEKFREPVLHMVSNSPEKINKDGVLFAQSLSLGSPVRLLYYHLNNTDSDKWLIIDIVNPYSISSRVWIVSGTGGPNPQEAFVGHVATSRFIKNSFYSSGQFYIIPPKGRTTIYVQKFGPKQILTGFFHLQFLPTSSLELIVRSESKPDGLPSTEILPKDEDSTHCRGVYPAPKVLIQDIYRAGDPEKSIYIGKAPFLKSIYDSEQLYGNYGVLYDITLNLINDDSLTRQVELSFTSQGGIAQGTFLIDGRLVETPIVRSSEHVPLAILFLKPNETRIIHLNTMPQGGSHYPVRILLKSKGL